MESLLVLVALIVLAIPVTIVILLVGLSRLRKRVEDLEQQIAQLSRPFERVKPPEKRTDPVAQEASRDAESVEKEKNVSPAPWSRPAVTEPDATEAATLTHPKSPATPPRAVVFRQDKFDALGKWLRENWFYAVSALSLTLAGIFLVQYGVENGLLPPAARIIAALGFGSVLIISGEVVRRRFGDDASSSTAYLPSVFSGSGLVTLFGGILAARQLYDLIGPEAALSAMVTIALMGLVLGWFHGPLLAAVGLIGAFAAPFLVGGSSEDPSWLYVYFFVVTVLGLGIDTVRRWAWISVLALVGAYASAWLVSLSSPSTDAALMVYSTLIALAAIVVPVRRLTPDHPGSMVLVSVRRKKGDPWPEFPTRLAFASVVVSTAFIALRWGGSETEFWLAVLILSGLAVALIVWASGARALQDTVLFPTTGLLWVVWGQGFDFGAVYRRFFETYTETPEADFPWVVTFLVVISALISVLSAWRSFRGGQMAVIWAGAAAIFAPTMAIVLEVAWQPAEVIGAYPWALHALVLGTLMVVFAERFARRDGEDRMRAALATLSALSCLTFACVIVLSSAALTVALAVTVVAAAALDRKFTLQPMSWFIAVGVVTLGYRLVVDPGLDWSDRAPLPEVVLAYGGTLAALVLSLYLLRPLSRPLARLMLDSAAWSTSGLFLSILLMRWLERIAGRADESHWGLGLLSVIWLGLAFAQVQRLELGGRLAMIRTGLAAVFGILGGVALVAALTDGNPLLARHAMPVIGPPIANTLAVSYLLPALVIGFSAWRIKSMPPLLRRTSGVAALALAALWLGLAIRHLWQGAAGMYHETGVTQPELYTYTITLLVIGAVLFYQSLARNSAIMRKAGLAVIGLAIAKVFLIDIAGLGGLIRVFSLLALGLALAGLAWLNRWAILRHSPQASEPLDQ